MVGLRVPPSAPPEDRIEVPPALNQLTAIHPQHVHVGQQQLDLSGIRLKVSQSFGHPGQVWTR